MRTCLLAILAALVIAPLATRWFYLRQVPEVSLPFDVEQFVGPEVPHEQDALTYYSSAAQTLKRVSSDWLFAAMNDARTFNGHWDERLDQWLIDNSDILAELKVGSNCERVSKSPFSPLGIDVSLLGGLRNLMRVSEAEAQRCERSGNLDEAWAWHRVSLRLGHHTEKRGLYIDHLFGSSIRDAALDSIGRWASHPSLTKETIRLARSELTELLSNRTTLSEAMKSEYLFAKHALESVDGPNDLFPELKNVSFIGPMSSHAKRIYSWSNGQPEVSLRFSRQILVNNGNQIDQPLHLRRQIVRSRYPMLFEPDPSQKKMTGQLDVIQLDKALEGSLGQRLRKIGLFFRLGTDEHGFADYDQTYRMQTANATMTTVVLAAQEFYRSHGEFPSNLEQLKPLYLETETLDPMSATGAPLNYRRDSPGNARVWSIGFNGIDDGGDIDGKDAKDRGYRIYLMDRVEPEQEKTKPVSNEDENETSK